MSAPAVKQSLPASGTPTKVGPGAPASGTTNNTQPPGVQKLSSMSPAKPPGSGNANHNVSNMPLSLVQEHKNGNGQNQALPGPQRGSDKNRDLASSGALKPTSNGVEGSPTKPQHGLTNSGNDKKSDESQAVGNHSADSSVTLSTPQPTQQSVLPTQQSQLQQLQMQQLLPQQQMMPQQQMVPQQQQSMIQPQILPQQQQQSQFMTQQHGMPRPSQQILPQQQIIAQQHLIAQQKQQMLGQQGMNQLLIPPQQMQSQQMIQAQQHMQAQQQMQAQQLQQHMQAQHAPGQQQIQTQAHMQVQQQQNLQPQHIQTQQQMQHMQTQQQVQPQLQVASQSLQQQVQLPQQQNSTVQQTQAQHVKGQQQLPEQQPQQQQNQGEKPPSTVQDNQEMQTQSNSVTEEQEVSTGVKLKIAVTSSTPENEAEVQKQGEKEKEEPGGKDQAPKDENVASENTATPSCTPGSDANKKEVTDSVKPDASSAVTEVAQKSMTEGNNVGGSEADSNTDVHNAGPSSSDNQTAGPSSKTDAAKSRADGPKSEYKVATPPRSSKRKRETKPHEEDKSTAKDTGEERKSKRVRTRTQPYQAPLPELQYISKLKTLMKSPDDKLIVFYKNEFLAVRNTEGGFFVCQALQNIYRSSPRIRIRWLSQEKKEKDSEVYIPDFYDATDFDCILTNLDLKKVDKNKYELPNEERERTQSILTRALQFEKGVEKPSVTEEHPDGLDLSLYKDEAQLKKKRNSKKRVAKKRTSSGTEGGASTSAADGESGEPPAKIAVKSKSPKKTEKSKSPSKEKSKAKDKEGSKKPERDNAREKRNSAKKKAEKSESSSKSKKNSSTTTKVTPEKKNSKITPTKKTDSAETSIPTRSAKTRSVKAGAAPSKTSPITRTKERERRGVNAKERKKPGKKA